jgi:hypothetical protein
VWNPRLYALIICVGMLAKWSHRATLRELDGEYGGWAGMIAFWIPLFGVIYIAGSFLIPVIARKVSRFRR